MSSATRGSGPVDVLYAGSLVALMDNGVGPAFGSSSGYTFIGTSGDSGSLANEIKGKVETGDVYISASAAKDALLEGTANGNWVSWYASFAQSPLVIGYNPKSKFAAQLASKPWYEVVDQPGFLLGRTDPATDPKGKLSVKALDQAATAHHQPALAALATSTSNLFAENTLVGRLQAGQLDAGFFYGVEAKAAGIPTVTLPGSTLAAHYTITVLAHAPHEAGALAFVRYLLEPAGAAELARAGLALTRPIQVSGTPPPSLIDRLY
ncbi:MAG TPA: substrate-binding domain-containing protein [Acidimicrobiales bacterium]|nr:substrate-binding domain-containing protein [Acidimicrobiales bacterium]